MFICLNQNKTVQFLQQKKKKELFFIGVLPMTRSLNRIDDRIEFQNYALNSIVHASIKLQATPIFQLLFSRV